ncbi:MAG: hypothetical protein P1V19_22375, partial [Gimesia sp.]|nr:hypothetical protein [Gimesia sp.]
YRLPLLKFGATNHFVKELYLKPMCEQFSPTGNKSGSLIISVPLKVSMNYLLKSLNSRLNLFRA